MKLSLTRQAQSDERAPTSALGLLHMLRAQLTAARSASAQSPMQALANGRLRGLVSAQTRSEIASALDLASQFHLDLVLLDADESGRMLDELKAAQMAVVMGPFSFATPRRVLMAPAALAKNGTRVAFTSRAPEDSPESLRFSAILAMREGMSEDDALRALTAVPAQLGGVEARVGTVAPGKDADLIVWSAPPFDARARIEAVYVRGTKVYPSITSPGHPKAP
jgi:imidazolonepropionase-like amidohydrolase